MSRYIDAEHLKQVIDATYDGCAIRIAPVDALITIIDCQTTADVAPVRHGHWIKLEANSLGWKYGCSDCNGWTMVATNFCPHCGARMDEEAEE